MARNLDIAALRSFVAVADCGGVTRAASRLSLTQSAVSMQLKRLEEALGEELMDRSRRGMTLTGSGEQLYSYARRMLELNDEVWSRLTDRVFEGEIRLGVPHDIVYPHIPEVLRRFAKLYPRVSVSLVSSCTSALKADFAAGEIDVILTTEEEPDAAADVLMAAPLVWVGAPGGSAWRQRPLPLAFERECIFRRTAQNRLDAAGIGWVLAVESVATRTVEACVSADFAIHCALAFNIPPHLVPIEHGGALPALPTTKIGLYVRGGDADLACRLADVVREAWHAGTAPLQLAAE